MISFNITNHDGPVVNSISTVARLPSYNLWQLVGKYASQVTSHPLHLCSLLIYLGCTSASDFRSICWT